MVSSFGFWWYTMVNTPDVLMGILLYEAFHAVQSLMLVRIATVGTVAAGGSVAPWAAVLCRRGFVAGLLLSDLRCCTGCRFI